MSDPLRLTFVTLVTRPENLGRISESLGEALARAEHASVEIDWVQMWDERAADFKQVESGIYPPHAYLVMPPAEWIGEPYLRNAALHVVKGGHIAWLDDDNLIVPSFVARVAELLAETPDAALVFDQSANGGLRLRAAPGSMIVGGVDTAQVVAPRDLYEGESFRNLSNGTDGYMYSALYAKAPERFRFINEAQVAYNALR